MVSLEKLIGLSVKPSLFVRERSIYKCWCSVTLCESCGQRAKYEDNHPVDPCMGCGERVSEVVGRWVEIKKPFWLFFSYAKGFWVVKNVDDIKEIERILSL